MAARGVSRVLLGAGADAVADARQFSVCGDRPSAQLTAGAAVHRRRKGGSRSAESGIRGDRGVSLGDGETRSESKLARLRRPQRNDLRVQRVTGELRVPPDHEALPFVEALAAIVRPDDIVRVQVIEG